MSLLKLEASNSFLEGKDCDISRIEQLQSNQDFISPNVTQNDNEIGNSFKLSPCKIGQNETQPVYATFNDKNISNFINKSPKNKAKSKVTSPTKKSPVKKQVRKDKI